VIEMNGKVPHGITEMAKYPLVFYLNGKAIIFGGGEVGIRKAASLAEHGVLVTVVDEKDITPPKGICFIKRHVDIDNFKDLIDDSTSLVVCALDYPGLNEKIAKYCMENGVLVNVATSRNEGNVSFPALIDVGEDIIAISSGGTCPQCSYALKRYLVKVAKGMDTFSRLVHELYDEDRLDRDVIARVLDDDNIMEMIKNEKYDEARDYLRKVTP